MPAAERRSEWNSRMLMAQLRDDGPLEAVCQFVPGTRKGQKTCSAPHVVVSR